MACRPHTWPSAVGEAARVLMAQIAIGRARPRRTGVQTGVWMGKGLILLYHRVADQPVDPFQLCVTADNFRGHLEYLQRRAAVVPLSEMLRKSTANRIAITFDDGYRDNAEIAAPALAAAGLPVTWFITVGRL